MGKVNSNLNKNRLKAIRKYVDFDFDLRKPLTGYQKTKIKKYYNEVDALTARPYYVYRPRKNENLKKAQIFAQHENQKLKGLKVAFIPTNGEEKPKISFDSKGELIAKTKHVTSRLFEFDMQKLIKDPIAHTKETIKKHPKIKAFKIQAGRYEINQSYSKDKIAEGVNKYTMAYGNEKKNNYFGNWLLGVVGYNFQNQDNYIDYEIAKTKSKEDIKRKRYNERKRQAYKKKKG